jgi:hypothetical protein
MESSKNFGLGPIIQKFLILEILKHTFQSKITCEIFLYELNINSRKYMRKNYIYIANKIKFGQILSLTPLIVSSFVYLRNKQNKFG